MAAAFLAALFLVLGERLALAFDLGQLRQISIGSEVEKLGESVPAQDLFRRDRSAWSLLLMRAKWISLERGAVWLWVASS